MKPILILPPKLMSAEDIKKLEDNGICCVVADNPAAVKFVDPLPAISSRTEIEQAAIQFSRKILDPQWKSDSSWNHRDILKIFIECLATGTPLDPNPSQAAVEKKVYDEERIYEMRKIAREDARAERAAKKAEQAKVKK